jgi:hypothetical protein
MKQAFEHRGGASPLARDGGRGGAAAGGRATERPLWKDYVSYLTWRRLGRLAYGVVVSLVVAEIGITVINPQREVMPSEMVSVDPDLGFRMLPNYRGVMAMNNTAVETNSWGLRDREYGVPSADKWRIYVLGDSMVFGFGVRAEETFPHYLEKLLRDRLQREVEVVNGGVPGYGTLQELEFFEQTVDQVQPDLVLVAVALLNDIADNRKFAERAQARQRPRGAVWKALRWLRSRSQLYLTVRRYRHASGGEALMQIHAPHPRPGTEQALQLTEQALLRFARVARGRGVDFAVVISPVYRQTSTEAWQRALASYQLDAGRYSREQPNRRLVSFAQAAGLPVLDLLPVLGASRSEDLYFHEHWRPRGHAVVATAVADFLVPGGPAKQTAARELLSAEAAADGSAPKPAALAQ